MITFIDLHPKLIVSTRNRLQSHYTNSNFVRYCGQRQSYSNMSMNFSLMQTRRHNTHAKTDLLSRIMYFACLAASDANCPTMHGPRPKSLYTHGGPSTDRPQAPTLYMYHPTGISIKEHTHGSNCVLHVREIAKRVSPVSHNRKNCQNCQNSR